MQPCALHLPLSPPYHLSSHQFKFTPDNTIYICPVSHLLILHGKIFWWFIEFPIYQTLLIPQTYEITLRTHSTCYYF